MMRDVTKYRVSILSLFSRFLPGSTKDSIGAVDKNKGKTAMYRLQEDV